jgi:hypothetical protein
MVDFVIVNFIVGHTHKVYDKGNIVVAYQNEMKTMNNVLYVHGVKKILLSIMLLRTWGML